MCVFDLESNKERFRYLCICSDAILSSFQHNKIYKDEVGNGDKVILKQTISEKLRTISVAYQTLVTKEAHINNVDNLARELTERHGDILESGRFRIGTAQKLLGIYLKLSWVFDLISEPPVCPFDGIIIDELGLDYRWTQFDDLEIYQEIIEAAEKKAGEVGLSLAKWELKLWMDKTQ